MKNIFLILLFFFYCISAAGESLTWGYQKSDINKSKKNIRFKRKVLVAIIDTGIDLNNDKLKHNLWINPGETGKDNLGRDKASNNIDDDKNGYIDDIHGWNFVNNSPNIQDSHGHGSHVAGIISQITSDSQLVILKFFDPRSKPQDNLKNTINAIKYATQLGVDIINYSGGGNVSSKEEEFAIREAFEKRILIVAAAGNERSNSDIYSFFPAGYNYSNILSVAAVNVNGRLIASSNYGNKTVSLSAPGENILSYLPSKKLGLMSGTSQATAFASGTAALYMQTLDFKVDPRQVILHLINTAEKSTHLKGKVRSEGYINGFRALRMKNSNSTAFGAIIINDYDKSNDFYSADSNL